jgi:hypothetical protein
MFMKLKIKWAIRFLRAIDRNMKRRHWSRQRRRAFWNDFMKHPALRESIYRQFEGNHNA